MASHTHGSQTQFLQLTVNDSKLNGALPQHLYAISNAELAYTLLRVPKLEPCESPRDNALDHPPLPKA